MMIVKQAGQPGDDTARALVWSAKLEQVFEGIRTASSVVYEGCMAERGWLLVPQSQAQR